MSSINVHISWRTRDVNDWFIIVSYLVHSNICNAIVFGFFWNSIGEAMWAYDLNKGDIVTRYARQTCIFDREWTFSPPIFKTFEVIISILVLFQNWLSLKNEKWNKIYHNQFWSNYFNSCFILKLVVTLHSLLSVDSLVHRCRIRSARGHGFKSGLRQGVLCLIFCFVVVVYLLFCPKPHHLSPNFKIFIAILICLVYLTYCKHWLPNIRV